MEFRPPPPPPHTTGSPIAMPAEVQKAPWGRPWSTEKPSWRPERPTDRLLYALQPRAPCKLASAVAIKGRKSGCRRSLAASTPQSTSWIKRRSNKPDGALGRHARRSRSHASHSPRCRRSRAHRPTSDSAGNCRSGSCTHKPGRSCRFPFSQDQRDRTRLVCRNSKPTDRRVACRWGGV